MEKLFSYWKKLVFELSRNARAPRKEIAKRVKVSPQLISYSTEKLKSNGFILDYAVLVDPAYFRLVNILEFFVFTTFENEKKKEILDYLENLEMVTHIETLSHGADLLVEFTVPNLSSFNKSHIEFLGRFSGHIKVLKIFPVIVKHYFQRNYLLRSNHVHSDIILSGDRPFLELKKNEKKVLYELIRNPLESVINISKNTGLNVRTVIRIIKFLESKGVIQGYTALINTYKIGIMCWNVLISFKFLNPEELKRIVAFAKTIPQIIEVIKVIGYYSFLIRIESLENPDKVIEKLRNEFKFSDYIVFDSKEVKKQSYIPLSVLR